jgi:hypothetical protein
MFLLPLYHAPAVRARIVLRYKKISMEVQKRSRPYEMTADEEEQFDAGFRPKGAMAFFILLVILGIIIWYGIYLIMAARI